MLIYARFAALILTALSLGLSFAHVLEMPAKLAYPPDLYLALQNSLYVAFGPPNVGAFVEPAAILAVVSLGYLVRRRRRALWLTVGSTACLLLALPVVFFIYTEPASTFFRAAHSELSPFTGGAIQTQRERSYSSPSPSPY